MREILFRGKDIDNGIFVTGYLIGNGTGKKYITLVGSHCKEVIPETIGQYTGLKDKNGKKIFEGDIVKVKSWYVVVFEDGAFGLKAYNKIKPVPLMGHINFEGVMREIEVIGNIHDNPELLKGE